MWRWMAPVRIFSKAGWRSASPSLMRSWPPATAAPLPEMDDVRQPMRVQLERDLEEHRVVLKQIGVEHP
jgi:hypothetical protein